MFGMHKDMTLPEISVALERLRDGLQGWVRSVDEVLVAQQKVKESDARVKQSAQEVVTRLRRADELMNQAKDEEKRAAQALQIAKDTAEEMKKKAEAHAQRIVTEANLQKGKFDGLRDQAKQELADLRRQLDTGQQELRDIQSRTQKAREAMSTLLRA